MINRWKTVTISYYEIRLMIKMEQSECQSIKLEKIPLDRKLIRKVSRPFILKKKKKIKSKVNKLKIVLCINNIKV